MLMWAIVLYAREKVKWNIKFLRCTFKPIQIFLEGKVSFSITYRRRQCEIIF